MKKKDERGQIYYRISKIYHKHPAEAKMEEDDPTKKMYVRGNKPVLVKHDSYFKVMKKEDLEMEFQLCALKYVLRTKQEDIIAKKERKIAMERRKKKLGQSFSSVFEAEEDHKKKKKEPQLPKGHGLMYAQSVMNLPGLSRVLEEQEAAAARAKQAAEMAKKEQAKIPPPKDKKGKGGKVAAATT